VHYLEASYNVNKIFYINNAFSILLLTQDNNGLCYLIYTHAGTKLTFLACVLLFSSFLTLGLNSLET